MPDGGSRSKAARVALHRYMMGINGTHITCYTTKDVGEDQAEAEGSKRKILSVEEIDAGFDLIREDDHRDINSFPSLLPFSLGDFRVVLGSGVNMFLMDFIFVLTSSLLLLPRMFEEGAKLTMRTMA